MRKTDLQDLLKTVEVVRREKQPGLDQAFLEAVVRFEEQFPDDEDAAVRAIDAALKALLEKQGAL